MHMDFQQIQIFSTIASQNCKLPNTFVVSLRLIIDPLSKFFKTYFLQRSFLDGSKGFVFSMMASISVFMKYAKQWEIMSINRKKARIAK